MPAGVRESLFSYTDMLAMDAPAIQARQTAGEIALEAAQELAASILGTSHQLTELGGSKNLFRASARSESLPGFFMCWGGNNFTLDPRTGDMKETREERLQIYLGGEACALISEWQLVKAQLELLQARITRVDLAADFVYGGFTVEDAINLYEQDGFTVRKRPKRRLIDDFNDGSGKTFYVGSRQSGKMCRIYEKGRQLGDPSSPWVRIETEFGTRDRILPLDILANPKAFLAGSYPALNFLGEVQETITAYRKQTEISVEVATYWARIQCGRLIGFLERGMGLDAREIFDSLSRAGDPPPRISTKLGAFALHDPDGLALFQRAYLELSATRRREYLDALAAYEVPKIDKNRSRQGLVKVGSVSSTPIPNPLKLALKGLNYPSLVLNLTSKLQPDLFAEESATRRRGYMDALAAYEASKQDRNEPRQGLAKVGAVSPT